MRPKRETIRSSGHTYFASSQTTQRKPFFRHERWAKLLQDVLQHYRGSSYHLHAYVIMPDHFHILISPQESLERAVQNIKGGFSFRAKKAFDWPHDIWQSGFSDHRDTNLDLIPQRLKPLTKAEVDGRAEALPLPTRVDTAEPALLSLKGNSANKEY